MEELKDAVQKGLKNSENLDDATGESQFWTDQDAFDVALTCGLRDQMGNKQEASQPPSLDVGPPLKCAYLKLINVPSLLDIGGTTPDPTDESLTLSMIDHATLSQISQFTQEPDTELGAELGAEELDAPGTGSKSENDDTPLVQLKKVIQALHMNQRVVHSKIILNDDRWGEQRPHISIDGVEYNTEEDTLIESITVSRVFKY